MSIETLELTGMDIDVVRWHGEIVRTRMAFGYTKKVYLGDDRGLYTWTISSGCLPDATAYGNLAGGVPRFQYYWDFFQARMAEGDGPFVFFFRGSNYHASFVDTEMTADMFTIDLFGVQGVQIRQRRLRGYTYDDDGRLVE